MKTKCIWLQCNLSDRVFALRYFIYILWSLVVQYKFFNFFMLVDIIWAVHLDLISTENFAVAPLSIIRTIEQTGSHSDKLFVPRYVLCRNVSHLHAAVDIIKVNLVISESFFAIMVSHINVSRCIFRFCWSLCHIRLLVFTDFYLPPLCVPRKL